MHNTAVVLQWNLMRQNHIIWVCSFLALTDVASVNSAIVMTTSAYLKRILCFKCNVLCVIHCFLWLGFHCECTDVQVVWHVVACTVCQCNQITVCWKGKQVSIAKSSGENLTVRTITEVTFLNKMILLTSLLFLVLMHILIFLLGENA